MFVTCSDVKSPQYTIKIHNEGGENIMKKVAKFIALLLAVLMLMTSFAFAAGSKEEPDKGKKIKGKSNEYIGYTDKKATMIGVKKSALKNKIKGVPNNPKIKGVKYTLTQINKNAFAKMKNLKEIRCTCKKAPKVQKGAFGKLKTKNIVFKVKTSMSKKQFKIFKSRLRKAGFKGTIKRVKKWK